MSRLDWEKARERDRTRQANQPAEPSQAGARQRAARQVVLARFVETHQIGCFKCGRHEGRVGKDRDLEARAVGDLRSMRLGVLTAREMKRCARCGETKPASAFYRRADGRTGLSSWCRACTYEARKGKYRYGPESTGDDAVECVLCGARRRLLGWHLKTAHGLNSDEYRRLHDAPTAAPAIARAQRDFMAIDRQGGEAAWNRKGSRKRYCKHGHLLLGKNVLVLKDGRRECRICTRERARAATLRWRARKIAADPTWQRRQTEKIEAYRTARRAGDPEFAERKRARHREH